MLKCLAEPSCDLVGRLAAASWAASSAAFLWGYWPAGVILAHADHDHCFQGIPGVLGRSQVTDPPGHARPAVVCPPLRCNPFQETEPLI